MNRLQRRGTDTVGPATHLEDELGLTEQRDHALHRRAALLLALDLVDHDLWAHGTRCVRHGEGQYAYGVRTVVPSCPVPPVRTARRRPVRKSRTVRRPRDVRVSLDHDRGRLLLVLGQLMLDPVGDLRRQTCGRKRCW